MCVIIILEIGGGVLVMLKVDFGLTTLEVLFDYITITLNTALLQYKK